jgi:hypothetical protein
LWHLSADSYSPSQPESAAADEGPPGMHRTKMRSPGFSATILRVMTFEEKFLAKEPLGRVLSSKHCGRSFGQHQASG